MALTLVEMIAGMKDKVAAGIVLQWARQSQIFQKIPFEGTDSFWTKTWQNESVSDAVFRQIGSSFAETKDKFVEDREGIYLLGGQLDVDTALELPANRELDVMAQNLSLQSERFRFGWTDTFINGDRAVDPDKFNGIKKRIEDNGGDQVIAGGGLDLSVSSSNRQQFLDLMDQAIFEVAEGAVDLIITSKQGMWSLNRVARREGLLDTTKDAFDRSVKTFMGIPVMFAGTKGDQSTQIITKTETNAGASTGGFSTSFYFVRFGGPYVTGMQMSEPKRIYDQVINDGVTRRVVFQWPVGLSQFHKRGSVRLRGVGHLGV